MSPLHRFRWLALAPPLTVGLATITCFLPAVRNDFVDWDDTANLANNTAYRGFGLANLRWMVSATLGGHWHPLTWLSFAADHALWGMNPAGYHLTNVLLHAAAAATVCSAIVVLLGRLPAPPAARAARLAALVAALFWALHPLRVESVAWVTERRDVLSGLFWALAILAYLRAQDPQARTDQRRWRLVASVGCLVLSLLAKSWGMSFVVVLLILDTWPLRRWWIERPGRVASEKLPFAVIGLVAIALAWRAVHPFVHDVESHRPGERLGQAAFGLLFYLVKTVWPAGLVPLVEFRGRIDPLAWPWLGYLGGVVGVTAVLVAARRRWPAGLASWIAYAAILAPVLGLSQAGPQMVADRYAYLSTLPIVALVAGGLAAVFERGGREVRWGVGCAAVMAVVVLATSTVRQIGVWRDSLTLWTHTVATVPDSAPARYYLGRALEKAGRVEEAEAQYRAVDDIADARPDDHVARAHRGLALARRGVLASEAGDHGRAVELLELAAVLAPRDIAVKLLLGHALLQAGRPADAASRWNEAAKGQRDEGRLRVVMASDLLQAGAWNEAERMLRAAAQLLPRMPEIPTLLGVALLRQGRQAEAVAAFRHALELDPGYAEAARWLAEVGKMG